MKQESKHNLNKKDTDWKGNNEKYLEFQRIQQKGDNLPFKHSNSMLVKIKFQKLNLRNQSVMQQTKWNQQNKKLPKRLHIYTQKLNL